MSISKQATPFDVMTVPLEGSNLIEASAGTGKTYSIAILVLRLILEKNIPLQEILMVTFTKAAVAELDDRIRNFVRQASRYSKGEDIRDATIKKIVDLTGKDIVSELLDTAVINLDEINVMTIHGFAQVTLNEFAFETGQLFSTELIPDTSDIIEKEVQEFWRKQVTVIHEKLLAGLMDSEVNLNQITKVIQEYLSGKSYKFYDSTEIYLLDEAKQQEYLEILSELQIQILDLKTKIFNYISVNKSYIIEACNRNSFAKKAFENSINHPETFLAIFEKKIETNYIDNLFPELKELVTKQIKNKEESKITGKLAANYLYATAIQIIVPRIESYKMTNNLISFDDMINKLHKSLVSGKNTNLAVRLQNKYKAVFIDEFQDTDKLQYEIFNTAFHQRSIMFYIGDPKQSIYGWRRADIATYFDARNHVDRLYSMNINYRSTGQLLDALNHFFLPKPDFDTFHYGSDEDRIDYHNVQSPAENTIGQLLYQNQPCIPVSIYDSTKIEGTLQNLTGLILDMLSQPDYSIYDIPTKSQRPVRPSDIGIIVRTNKKGLHIKEELSKLGIPAVTVSDDKILQSDQARELVYIVEAMLLPVKSNIRRVLALTMFHYDIKNILSMDIEKATEIFRSYHELWKSRSIYSALTQLYHDFDIRQKLLHPDENNGERKLTNLLHLTEMLYKTEHRRNFSPPELINWLKVNLKKDQSSDDEWEQRIENDEESVKIVTIHKSKGLEYRIVFAADSDFATANKNNNMVGFRDDNGIYVTALYGQLEEGEKILYDKQQQQENRRLLYVTLTRAAYACFIFNSKTNVSNSTLSFFTKEIENNSLIQTFQEQYVRKSKSKYTAPNHETSQKLLKPDLFSLKDINWSKVSYSSIARHPEKPFRNNIITETEGYEAFIFNDLPKGSNTGNFLHYIMEHIDFTQSDIWSQVIERATKQYFSNKSNNFTEYIFQLLEHVMYTDIHVETGNLKLSDVPLSQCLHEFEFDFPISDFNVTQLMDLMPGGIITGEKYNEVAGMMNGKIDLFFEYGGQYYILDWKSNHLGYSLDAYTTNKTSEAMSDNNYHLQYLIYSYAIRKYLQFRKGASFDYTRDFGGVIYLFLRGVRKDSNHGIFYYKPRLDQITKMERLFG